LFIWGHFTAVGDADKARASQPSAPPSTGGARLSRARRLLSYLFLFLQAPIYDDELREEEEMMNDSGDEQ